MLVLVVANDFPYLQESSFRSLFANQEPAGGWEVLPFTLTKSMSKKNTLISAKVGEGSCMFAVSEGVLYASAEKTPMTPIYTNPFTEWAQVGDTKYSDISAMTIINNENNKNGTTIYGLTSNNIANIQLSQPTDGYPCGKINDIKLLLTDNEVESWGKIQGLQYAKSLEILFIASQDKGLFKINLRESDSSAISVSMVDISGKSSNVILWVEKWKTLYTANNLALYTLKFCPKKQEIISEDHEWIGGSIGTIPTDMDFDDINNVVWLSESESIHKFGQDQIYWRMGYQQGAPMLNTTSVGVHKGIVFSGAIDYGVARVNGKQSVAQLDVQPDSSTTTTSASTDESDTSNGIDGDPWSWLYYYGQRWLPSNDVYAVVPTLQNNRNSVMIVTSTGMALINIGEMTLNEKRHWQEDQTSPAFMRHGLVTQLTLKVPGDLSQYTKGVGDNDGLWTSMAAIGEVYRYMSTKEIEAKKQSWIYFQGLEMLSKLSGAYPHFTARSFSKLSDHDAGLPAEIDPTCTSDCWYNSPTEGWWYKGDTSSDELCGHFAIYPMIYDNIASTSDEKKRVLTLYEGLIEGIVDNDLYFIQPATNERTTWGFWNPKEVNGMPEHYSERGTNSLEILAWLSGIYSVTGKEKYLNTFNDLVNKHKYYQNTMNVKIDSNIDENHSDTELIQLAYQAMFYSYERLPEGHERKEQVWKMISPVLPSLQRSFVLCKGELSPLWLGIYYGTAAQRKYVNNKDLTNAAWTLRHWQMDNMNWGISGSQRIDLDISKFLVRLSQDPANVLMRHIRPPQERESGEWNRDPFSVNAGGNGGTAYEPGPYLFPYWIMRYYGMI
ncbi:MAG: hypothetical protein HOM72_04235 [Actinobacteria bacterium]|nr:hypothetical protein [Actinomycetota bacterium]